jgi:hypothetical protein
MLQTEFEALTATKALRSMHFDGWWGRMGELKIDSDLFMQKCLLIIEIS